MESRTIQLTSAALKYGNLNLCSCGKDFFPPDVFGSPNKKAGLGNPITLKVEGLPNPIETDIPTDKKTGKPRWIFRKRSWSKKFVEFHNLKAGDTIVLIRNTSRKYFITPNGKNITKETFFATQAKANKDLVTLEDAARIAGKTPHNIRYYIQVGRINKYDPLGNKISKARNGELRVSLKELTEFLDILEQDRQRHHCPGQNEELGFYGLPEYERTKHVHRLHLCSGEFRYGGGGNTLQ
jgi:hypothetical protein